MNRDDIIRMALEAGFHDHEQNSPPESFNDLIAINEYSIGDAVERFAALVAAAEREACAKVCDEFDCENPYIGQARAVAFEIRQRNAKNDE